MDRTIKTIITAAAATAAATMSVATVSTETARAATFLYTGTAATAKFREAELFLTVNEWTDVSQIDYQAMFYSLTGWRLGLGNSEYSEDDLDFGYNAEIGDLMWVKVFDPSGRSVTIAPLRTSQAASDWRPANAKVPEPSSAIALVGACALGAVASKRRRRS